MICGRFRQALGHWRRALPAAGRECEGRTTGDRGKTAAFRSSFPLSPKVFPSRSPFLTFNPFIVLLSLSGLLFRWFSVFGTIPHSSFRTSNFSFRIILRRSKKGVSLQRRPFRFPVYCPSWKKVGRMS